MLVRSAILCLLNINFWMISISIFLFIFLCQNPVPVQQFSQREKELFVPPPRHNKYQEQKEVPSPNFTKSKWTTDVALGASHPISTES